MNEHDRVVVHSSSSAVWRTPPKLFIKLALEGGIEADLAADARSALCSAGHYFGPDHALEHRRDGLTVMWASEYRVGFVNPPFSRDEGLPIEPWMRKAAQETIYGFTTFGLIPVRTSTKWWNDWVMQADEIRTIPHRVKFLYPDGSEGTSAPFDSCVAVWRPRGGRPSSTPPRFFAWDYL